MTVQTTNRSHRIAFMLLLLIAAVVLTTALVFAADRSTSSVKHSSGKHIVALQVSEMAIGAWRWT